MKHPHNAREHLRRHILVNLRVLLEIERGSLPENCVDKPDDLVLIELPLIKALLRAVIQTFLIRLCFRKNGLGCVDFLVSFEGDVAEQDTHILALQHPILVEVVPI